MSNSKRTNFRLSDSPGKTEKDDYLEVKSKFVNKIFDFIQDTTFAPLTIAITGEWGIGKTTVLNLLSEKLKENKNNVLIFFEPLIEGKFEITDMIELFYLKLYQCLNAEKGLKDIIKKSIVSLLLISRCKISGSLNLPGEILGVSGADAKADVEYDWGKNVDDLLEVWKNNKPKEFSEQVKKLNEILDDSEYKIYIFIDEIDRLPAGYIVNFLLFCRILESFNKIFCIVGIDYKQVVTKLCAEYFLKEFDRNSNYNLAVSYLDKLFQLKFHIHHNTEKKFNFAIQYLNQIDTHKVLANFISPDISKGIDEKFTEIIRYLSTPRQIKKWILAIRANYNILRYSPNKLVLLGLLAVIVKHPIVSDQLAKEINSLCANRDNQEIFRQFFDNELPTLAKEISVINFVNDYIKETPTYLIILFFEGFIKPEHLSLYSDFFTAKIDQAINVLLNDNLEIVRGAFDLAESLTKNFLEIEKSPSIELLNKLWIKEAEQLNFINPYLTIVTFALGKLAVEYIIENAVLTLSEQYILKILSVCNIQNIDGSYNLAKFKKPENFNLSNYGLKFTKWN